MGVLTFERITVTEGTIGLIDRSIMELALGAAWNRYADAFNSEIDQWNAEWNELYPDAYVGEGSPMEPIYLEFLCIRAQRIVDTINALYRKSFPYELCIDDHTQLQIRMKENKNNILGFLFKEV